MVSIKPAKVKTDFLKYRFEIMGTMVVFLSRFLLCKQVDWNAFVCLEK